MLKVFEAILKRALATVLAGLLYRPWRRRRLGQLASAKRVLVVRIDRRVGEVLLTTPLLQHLAGLEVQLLVHPDMVRVADGLPGVSAVHGFGPAWQALFRLRALRFDVVVNAANWTTPSVTSAVVARLIAGAGVVVGPATPPSSWLMDVAVAPAEGPSSEAEQRMHLASPLQRPKSPATLAFRAPRPSAAVRAFRATLPARYVVINPGGRLGPRRVSPEVFAVAADAILSAGVQPVVTWGPGEMVLVEALRGRCPQAIAAPATDLDDLAFLLTEAVATVCNNTGPMHLAVAVGSPTLAFFVGIDQARWGHAGARHRMVDVTPVVGDEAALKALVSRSVAEHLSAKTRAPH